MELERYKTSHFTIASLLKGMQCLNDAQVDQLTTLCFNKAITTTRSNSDVTIELLYACYNKLAGGMEYSQLVEKLKER